MKNMTSRRNFLRKILITGSAPLVLPSSLLFGANKPSERINLASIGVGGEGTGLLNATLQADWIRVVAISDCFRAKRLDRCRRANQRYGGKVCTPYLDFHEILERPDVDGILCATPDHWHLGVAIESMRAGKDVYIEKPLTLSIEDNKRIRKAVHRYGRIFQYGTQQRSLPHVRRGCELVRSGILGKLKRIDILAPKGRLGGGSLTPAPVPDGLDYDRWLGPSRLRPYTVDRCSSAASWYSSENSIGFLGGWGAHPLDVMCWALGDTPDTVPVEIKAVGKRKPDSLYDTVAEWEAHGHFANGVEFTFRSAMTNWTTFVGENGSISISRQSLVANPIHLLRSPLARTVTPLRDNTTGFHHTVDFADCIKTRETPSSNIEGAYHSDNISQLTNISCLTGRTIKWDIAKQEIIGDPEAWKMAQSRAQRTPYIV